MNIARERMDYIDANFNEANKPSLIEFQKLQTADELHYVVLNWNWDNGLDILQWIAESNLCSEATALKIFWLSQPQDYTIYNWNAKKIPKNVDMNAFVLIRTIMENYKNGFYKKTDISYDPIDDMASSDIVPEFMYQPTIGEVPYIYYTKNEVRLWFGEYLANQISQCDNVIDLFNIAALLGDNQIEAFELILNHPCCDKGIALMVFWHMKVYDNLYDIKNILNEIVRKIYNKEYSEAILYNPNEDIDTGLTHISKWKIPENMKNAVNM